MTASYLVTVPIPQAGLDLLRNHGRTHVCDVQPSIEDLREEVRSGRWSVIISQLTDVLDAPTLAEAKIAGISNYAVGYNNVDIAAATERGIVVANTPGVLTDSTADIAMLLILATARRCLEADALTRSGRFVGWAPELMLGLDVSGATLGLVGSGRIARATARRAAAFGMRIQHCSVREAPGGPTREETEANLGEKISFDQLVESSDFVSLHVPLTPQTRHLVDIGVLGRMKRTAILVNTARGPIVDEAALVRALQDNQIAGAGLDVYEDEPRLSPGLSELSNTVLLPHVGSATLKVREQMAVLCARNAIAIGRGELPPHPVNPQAWLA